jgi:hypothetical protein
VKEINQEGVDDANEEECLSKRLPTKGKPGNCFLLGGVTGVDKHLSKTRHGKTHQCGGKSR